MTVTSPAPLREISLTTNQIQRPQPVGVFPSPAAFLLLPHTSDPTGIQELLRGDLSQPLPPQWEFFRTAALGHAQQAKQLLADDDAPLALYNVFVLEGGDASRYQELQSTLQGQLKAFLTIAAFQFGLIDELPNANLLDGELRAALLLARASQSLEKQDTNQAILVLEEAFECAQTISPVFAAQILGQIAALRSNTPGQNSESVAENYRQAIQLAGDTPLASLRAELWLNLGSFYQEQAGGRRDLLAQSIQAYQQAIQCGISETNHADMYALAQNNLGLAYLTMPMVEASDSLRQAVAVQSFREALKIYQPQTHRLEWVSTKLNLANALQYLPTSHPEENLLQAVEIYDELLQARTRAEDPVGYARLLANQANALAHLGLFSQSLEKANEAYKLFQWHNETDAANSVLELVTMVHESVGNKQVTA